ncbi:MAG: hypothetical protein YHS30scaffold324_14 [Catenulispora phage 69_17]|jgi:hypothetical protein|nr:MAG: hypothetical protein YHS30scaffold324_14 [Catenulispora phage 69_17]
MYRLAITCNEATSGFERCEILQPPEDMAFEDYASWTEATLKECGWSTQGEAHFCSKHNPASKGKLVEVGSVYVEILPGVRVRRPGVDFPLPLEIQVQDRECHGYDGAVCGGGSGVYAPGTEYAAWHSPEAKADAS